MARNPLIENYYKQGGTPVGNAPTGGESQNLSIPAGKERNPLIQNYYNQDRGAVPIEEEKPSLGKTLLYDFTIGPAAKMGANIAAGTGLIPQRQPIFIGTPENKEGTYTPPNTLLNQLGNVLDVGLTYGTLGIGGLGERALSKAGTKTIKTLSRAELEAKAIKAMEETAAKEAADASAKAALDAKQAEKTALINAENKAKIRASKIAKGKSTVGAEADKLTEEWKLRPETKPPESAEIVLPKPGTKIKTVKGKVTEVRTGPVTPATPLSTLGAGETVANTAKLAYPVAAGAGVAKKLVMPLLPKLARVGAEAIEPTEAELKVIEIEQALERAAAETRQNKAALRGRLRVAKTLEARGNEAAAAQARGEAEALATKIEEDKKYNKFLADAKKGIKTEPIPPKPLLPPAEQKELAEQGLRNATGKETVSTTSTDAVTKKLSKQAKLIRPEPDVVAEELLGPEAEKMGVKYKDAIAKATKDKFLKSIFRDAAIGAGFGFAKRAQTKDATFTKSLEDAALGGLIGGALPLAFKGLSKPFSFLYDNALTRAIKASSLYQMVGSVSNVLKNMGPSGERLANLLLKSREITERIASLHWSVVDRAWSKLSKKEAADLVDVIEGRATIALNQKQEMARGLFEAEREKLAEDFKSRGFTMIRNKMELDPASGQMVSKGTEEVPFATRANYFPHQVDTEKLDSRGITRIIKHLVDTGQAKNEGDALELYQNYMKEFRQRRAGSMEHSRSPIELPEDMYVKDPRTRIHDYLFDSYRRLIESEPMMLGKNDANAYALLEGIRKDMTSRGGSDSYASQQVLLAEKMLNRVLGKDMEFEPELLRMARLWQMPSLGLSAIPNAFQSVNTAVAMGIRNTIRGIGDFMGQEGKDFAMRAGAISESVSRELSPDLAGGLGERFAKGIFKYTGFNLTEKWNRGIASNTAKYYLMDLMKIMQRNPLDKQALLKMYEIGVSPSALREMQASGWTEVGANIFEAVGQKMSNYTQHRSGVLDLPLFFTSPYGRFLTQFKNFPFKQAQFISKEVFKEAANGNFTPLIRFAVLGTSMGEASADLKALARGDTKRWNKPAVQREIENMTAVGAMGVFSDTIQSFVSGGTSPYKMLVGPTLGDVVTAGTAVAQGAQGRVRPIEKFGTSQIPIVGPWITNKLFPPLR